jgi:anaerobic ribonucleoside-triphosphate reductase activating protein
MNYHDITHDDMKNGDGLRVVLWVAGCNHHCKGCQNPVTWNPEDGKPFGTDEQVEISTELQKPHISGLTLSGGDPFHPANRLTCTSLCAWVKATHPEKTIWCYTGYTWEEVNDLPIMEYLDVLVEGEFVEALKDTNYHWAGSTNQRVIDVQKSLKEGVIVPHESY